MKVCKRYSFVDLHDRLAIMLNYFNLTLIFLSCDFFMDLKVPINTLWIESNSEVKCHLFVVGIYIVRKTRTLEFK